MRRSFDKKRGLLHKFFFLLWLFYSASSSYEEELLFNDFFMSLIGEKLEEICWWCFVWLFFVFSGNVPYWFWWDHKKNYPKQSVTDLLHWDGFSFGKFLNYDMMGRVLWLFMDPVMWFSLFDRWKDSIYGRNYYRKTVKWVWRILILHVPISQSINSAVKHYIHILHN